MTGETRYPIRDTAGVLQAIHVRIDYADGDKSMSWRGPDGDYGLSGRRGDSLPLYGSENVPDWPLDQWIVVTEGERDCNALTAHDVPALATVTGAASCPTVDALRPVAARRRFILWPDNDDAGRAHMSQLARNLYRAGARSVFTMVYTPTNIPWPKGAGAADYVDAVTPIDAARAVALIVEEYAERILPPGPEVTTTTRRTGLRPHVDTGSVSAALIEVGVVNARPGRNVRCPAHDDRHASLSVFRDDLRAKCHAASCAWSGRGVNAADVLAWAVRS